MKVYLTNEIKNIALLGNDGSGNTTLTEALLYEAGLIKRRGRITAKNTVSDYFPVEQEYGYSVFSTVYHVEWNNKKLNIIDCPGSVNFVRATLTALKETEKKKKICWCGVVGTECDGDGRVAVDRAIWCGSRDAESFQIYGKVREARDFSGKPVG